MVLPAAAFAEKDGTFSNTERRVQRIRKAIDAPGLAKPDWLILMDLMNRLGYNKNMIILQKYLIDSISDTFLCRHRLSKNRE